MAVVLAEQREGECEFAHCSADATEEADGYSFCSACLRLHRRMFGGDVAVVCTRCGARFSYRWRGGRPRTRCDGCRAA